MRPRSASAARTREALRDAVQIYAPSTVYAVGLGAMTPALAVAALALGLDAARAAAVVLLVGLGSLVANGPASALAARAGERVTMVVSAGLGTVGAGLAWATTAGVSSGPSAAGVAEPGRLALFLAAVLAVGMAGAGFNLARQAYLAVAVPATHRARAMSTLGGTVRIGTFLGPFLGAAAQAPLGLDGAFAAAAAAMAVGALLCLRIRDLPVPASDPAAGEEPGPAGRPRLRDVARARRGALLTAGFGVVAVSAARAARNAVIPLWATHLGLDAATASLVFGLAGAADLLLFYPSGRLMDRFGRRAVAVPCLTLLGAGFLAISLTREPTAFAAAAVLLGIGNGFGAGIVMTLGADHSPPNARAPFLGLWRSMSDAGMLAGPLLLSGATAAAGLAVGVGSLAVVCGLGAVVFAAVLPRGPGAVADPPPVVVRSR
ncbi:MFS transporter [Micrococcus luteus]|uniref:MFS transporter n=1 Tax=Micrococcus TaxID=1269 RepID=UPI000BA50348|nr:MULTISPECIES: MFS transporter [Micrococcus]MBU8762404.1 MFS transporter [Micrococcus luteus]MCT1811412.1 MFS transporter [Micrococcus luteus]MCT2067630.1 MFS transporter [Micrococcus luteus]MCV7462610.1 MFS transporter [Micrococcus luteus]MCV7464509.1 MFS transporter [Micrococcus luteus]